MAWSDFDPFYAEGDLGYFLRHGTTSRLPPRGEAPGAGYYAAQGLSPGKGYAGAPLNNDTYQKSQRDAMEMNAGGGYREDPRLAESLRMQDELIAQFRDPAAYQRANQTQLDAIGNMARSQAVRSGVQGPLRGTMATNAQVGLSAALEQQRLQNLRAALGGRTDLVRSSVDARSEYAKYIDRIRQQRAQEEAQRYSQLFGLGGMVLGGVAGGLAAGIPSGGTLAIPGAIAGAGLGRGLGEAAAGQLSPTYY